MIVLKLKQLGNYYEVVGIVNSTEWYINQRLKKTDVERILNRMAQGRQPVKVEIR